MLFKNGISCENKAQKAEAYIPVYYYVWKKRGGILFRRRIPLMFTGKAKLSGIDVKSEKKKSQKKIGKEGGEATEYVSSFLYSAIQVLTVQSSFSKDILSEFTIARFMLVAFQKTYQYL